jgi:rhamnulokinase
LPELIVNHLAGVRVTERTSAGSSGLVDLGTGGWSPDLLALAGVDPALLGEIERAGQVVGLWRDVPVSLVGGHDTASAVAGMGVTSTGGSAFVASGTWMLTGVERSQPDTSDWARAHNFTNEAGALDGVRFLRNVTGFWLLEQCRPAWGNPPVHQLIAEAEATHHAVPIVDVDHQSVRAPDDMLTAYTGLAGLPRDTPRGLVVRSIVESIASRTADVIAEIAEVSAFDDVFLFGGAARIDLLARLLTETTRRPIRIGPAEAAALGNAIVQGVAIGVFSTLDEGRAKIGRSKPTGSNG